MAHERILTGMRPSGRLHLGHFHGVLANLLRLQATHECFVFVADWHALTTEYADPSSLRESTREMVIDWLACGLEGPRTVLFRQSDIKEVAELFLLLAMITPLGWLERNPTYKEQLEEMKGRDLQTSGFLNYPVLQTADIILYKATQVPVGVDQAPHLELSREITRRFNRFYGPLFPEPQTLLAPEPKVPGTDGRKMSKSYGNAIYLSDPPEAVWSKLSTMKTDTRRKRREDPGVPEDCPVFHLHKLDSPPDVVRNVEEGCRTAAISCLECKRRLQTHLEASLAPIRKRRAELEAAPGRIEQVLEAGGRAARSAAQATMREVRAALKLAGPEGRP